MKRSYWMVLCAVAAVAFAVPAFAADPKSDPVEDNTPMTGPNCDLTGYKLDGAVAFQPAFAIPDNNRADALVGSFAVPADGSYFTDVLAVVNIGHTWVGDVTLRLQYFNNCADATPAASVDLICRPRGTAATVSAPCGPGAITGVGASGNIGTTSASTGNLPARYAFSDDATAKIADGVNPALTPAGCFKPSVGTMQAFDGLLKGGCFKLLAGDYAGLDLGTISGFEVHSLNERPVPTAARSWGAVKTIYR